MAFRSRNLFEITVICDKCGKARKTIMPTLTFDTEMEAAFQVGYSFEHDGKDKFKNICPECREI